MLFYDSNVLHPRTYCLFLCIIFWDVIKVGFLTGCDWQMAGRKWYKASVLIEKRSETELSMLCLSPVPDFDVED